LFQPACVGDRLVAFGDYIWLSNLVAEAGVSLATSLCLLWPGVAAGWGVSMRLVDAVDAWLILSAFAAIVDILDGCANRPIRALVAPGPSGRSRGLPCHANAVSGTEKHE
jgi:hypothetical protein